MFSMGVVRRVLRPDRAARSATPVRTLRLSPVCSPAATTLADVARTARTRCAGVVAAAALSSESSQRAAAAGHRACRGGLKLRLASDTDPVVRAVAADPCRLARDNDPRMRAAATAATDRDVLSRVLNVLGCDPERSVRATVASHPQTGRWALARLAADGSADVRFAAAANPSTPPQALVVLAADEELAVRSAVGTNVSIPAQAVAALTAVPANPVCEVLAANPSTPLDVLTRLGVRDCLHDDDTTESCECRYDGEAFEVVLAAVLNNPSTPADLAATLRQYWADIWPDSIPSISGPTVWQDASDDVGCSETAAALAITDPEPLTQLGWARHPDDFVRRDLALNPRLAAGTAALLSSDNDSEVLHNLLCNPACPQQTLRAHTASGRPLSEVQAAAANPSCGPETLAEMAASADHSLRLRVAANPSCGPETLLELASHAHRLVREAVLNNPSCTLDALTAAAAAAAVAGDSASAPFIAIAALRLRGAAG